ncbi:hypothetical protein [Alloyangia pacifica]|uniref:hypothetical protein n=1 Tax=Alloyangia pacifica TaxID=311180 RepID=UPI001CFED8F4|nr:hypothetical protein [Alloyangia pacifica]
MTQEIPVATYWWQVTAALPTGRDTREYYVLRRQWADHTTNARKSSRGYNRWGNEDNMTPSLFQIWAVFPDPEAMRGFLSAAGVEVQGKLRSVTWAYSHEEATGPAGKKLIADIVIHFVDNEGPGILVLEVKRPGNHPTKADTHKLSGYTNLRSVRKIARRHGAFLVGAKSAARAAALSSIYPVMTWDEMWLLQMVAAEEHLSPVTLPWIDRAYARYGIGEAGAPASVGSGEHGDESAIQAIRLMNLPARELNFLLGSECVEAFLAGHCPPPPLPWLKGAKSMEEMCDRSLQETWVRRIIRWGPDWSPQQEPRDP